MPAKVVILCSRIIGMQTSSGECELVGVMIGDGHVYRNFGKNLMGITGDKLSDAEYFEYLVGLIKSEWGLTVKPVFRSGGLRLVFYSKKIANRLNGLFGFPLGKKALTIQIPSFLATNWNTVKHVLRGIADTDGSVFVSKKPGIDKYPSLEITTTSNVLATQVRNSLIANGFRVSNIRVLHSKLSKNPSYKVALFGWKNLLRWYREIGFSNPVKRRKAESILLAKYGNL